MDKSVHGGGGVVSNYFVHDIGTIAGATSPRIEPRAPTAMICLSPWFFSIGG